VRQRGSRMQFTHLDHPGRRVTVAGQANLDLREDTLNSISVRAAGSKPMRHAVVIEKSETGYGAYVPDLPGCVAVGETLEETSRLKEAIEFHLEGMQQDGVPFPEPTSLAEYVEV
jgi:predicted RNase H-like HicB family nuclease